MRREARPEELKEIFRDVDSDVLWDLYMAGIVTYAPFEGPAIDHPVEMFAFIMRRLFPAVEDSDE